MLNDDRPRPEDLPDAPIDAPMDAPMFPGAGESASDDRDRSSARPLIALAVVLALLAVTVLAVWALGNRGTPAAGPTPSMSSTSSAATGTATSSGPTGSSSVPAASAGSPPELAAFYGQPLDWADCPGSPQHQCATIEVPVDYAKPDGDRFTLDLRKVPALDPARRVGSLLVNPGGPGGSGLEYAQYSSFVFSKQLRQVYDVVGFDPRGIGESDAVACLTDDDMDQLFADDPTPDTAAERDQLFSNADAITKRCAAKGGQRALHMSTTEVARDMDVMRALLGDDELNYFGVSYGTFLGALYADLFPKRVGRFVLDSAMSPNQTELQEMDYDIQGFESSIDAFLTWCVARSDCVLGKDKRAAKDKIVNLLDQVDRVPLTTSKPGLPRIGEGWVGFAIFMCLYSDTTWSTLNKGLGEALSGKGDILLARAMAVVGRGVTGHYAESSFLHAMLPVRCADWARTPDTTALRAARAKARADHALWGRMTGELYDNCVTWPIPGRAAKAGTLASGAAPILVIGNLRDPATPIGGTRQLAKDLDSGMLVTSDHDGHGTYYAGDPCVDEIVDNYLIRGKVPPGDTAC